VALLGRTTFGRRIYAVGNSPLQRRRGRRQPDHWRARSLPWHAGGDVLPLMALSTLLAGTTLPHSARDIIFGLTVLGAVLALRERAN